MKWPNEEVSENGSVFPVGMYTLKVVSQKDGEAKNGQATIEVKTRILKPAQFRGQPYDFRFIIGVTKETAEKLGLDEEDLSAENEVTWKANPSARKYKTFIKKAGVPDTGDTEEEAEGVVGKIVGVYNENRENGKYNEASRFYTEQESETQPTAKSAAPSAKLAAKSATKTTAKPAAEDADSVWDA